MTGDRRGFALIAALWLLVALSVVGLEFGLRSRARRLAVANAVEHSVARAAADGGLERAHARLGLALQQARDFATADPDRFLDPWGRPDTVGGRPLELGAAVVSLQLEDAGARVQLNLADEESLRRLFRAVRVDFGEADRLAQAIADWRDPDQLHRARGAERDAYLQAGATVLPKDGPFARVSDLRQVRGMTPELFRRVEPLLGIRGTGRISLNNAPRPVLLSLPGMTEAAVTLIERRRQAHRPIRSLETLLLELPEGPRNELRAALPALQGRIGFETQEILVTATARVAGSPVEARIQGLFVRAGDALFLTWRSSD